MKKRRTQRIAVSQNHAYHTSVAHHAVRTKGNRWLHAGTPSEKNAREGKPQLVRTVRLSRKSMVPFVAHFKWDGAILPVRQTQKTVPPHFGREIPMLQARGSDLPRAERVGNTPCAFVTLFVPSEVARGCCSGVEGLRGPREAAPDLRELCGAASPSKSIAIADVLPQEELPRWPCWREPRSSCAAAGAGPREAFQSISTLRDPAAGVTQCVSTSGCGAALF